MAIWRVNNSTPLGGEICAPWVVNHVYGLGARVVCRIAYATVARRAFVYECTTPGTSHATTEPTWPTSGTVADNDIVWTTRSPDDSNWDNASCILAYVLNHTTIAAGDFVYIDDGHNEATNITADNYILKGASSVSNPLRIFCVDKASDSLSTGAIVEATNTTYNFMMKGFGFSYGVTYIANKLIRLFDSTNGVFWILEGSGETVVLRMKTGGNYITFDDAADRDRLEIIRAAIQLDNLTNYIICGASSAFIWKGGKVIAANGVTKLFDSFGGYVPIVIVEDVDLDEVGAGATATALYDSIHGDSSELLFSRCKLPSDAGFVPNVGAWPRSKQGKIRLHHCSSANKTYDFYEDSYEGNVQDEIAIIRDGGASDGTTPQSWKMVSSANTVDNINALISPPMPDWTESTTSKTFTVECLVDSAINLQNDEVWMEFEYPINNTDGLGGFARDKCAMLGTPADKSSSAVTWNGTGGMANPNKFKCSVTVTPGKKGPITARICLAKPSTTIYVDPLITES